jgi:hypothetical protein
MYPLRVKLTTIPLSRAEIKNGGATSLLPHTPLWLGDLLIKYRVAVIIIIIIIIAIQPFVRPWLLFSSLIPYTSDLQPGVRVPSGVRENILRV